MDVGRHVVIATDEAKVRLNAGPYGHSAVEGLVDEDQVLSAGDVSLGPAVRHEFFVVAVVLSLCVDNLNALMITH